MTALGLIIRRMCEEERLRRKFAGKTREDMRALWDDEAHIDDCDDIHSYMNLTGDCDYCAV